VKHILREHGLQEENILYGQSICPDEINNGKGSLPEMLTDLFGQVFPLGGIGAAPFVGKTGFGAFASHVPDGGDVFLLYGPHVGVSNAGQVGKILRAGQANESTACGALVAAYNSCCKGEHEDCDLDMQQSWLRRHLAAHTEDISKAPEPLAALAVCSYELVHQKLMSIVNTNFGGRLILLGGIQINTSEGTEDHFCPFNFEILSSGKEPVDLMDPFFRKGALTAEVGKNFLESGSMVAKRVSDSEVVPCQENALITGCASDAELRKTVSKTGLQDQLENHVFAHQLWFSWLGLSPGAGSPCERAINSCFPASVPGLAVLQRTKHTLLQHGMTAENTLYGQSICSDEINNMPGTMADYFKTYFGKVFPFGGISGAPFVGKTGFGAFSAHVPKDGHILIVYGPHVGVSEEGNVGEILRLGQDKCSTACGALVAAYNSCCAGKHGKVHEQDQDMQQNWLREQMLPYTKSIKDAANPMAALAVHSFEIVHQKMMSIVNTNFGSGKLVLLGGVQINTPLGYEDHFCPFHFEMRQAGQAPVDLMSAFNMSEL